MIKNRSMECIFTMSNVSEITKEDSFLVREHVKTFSDQIKIVKNAMILFEPTFNIYDDNKFKKYVSDIIGFEASQNEVNINSEFKRKNISGAIAFYFFSSFNCKLEELYPENKYCSILSLNNRNCWTYRFHIVRNGYELWINEDIESYSDPVMYEIF